MKATQPSVAATAIPTSKKSLRVGMVVSSGGVLRCDATVPRNRSIVYLMAVTAGCYGRMFHGAIRFTIPSLTISVCNKIAPK
jgi:hypothetical protein